MQINPRMDPLSYYRRFILRTAIFYFIVTGVQANDNKIKSNINATVKEDYNETWTAAMEKAYEDSVEAIIKSMYEDKNKMNQLVTTMINLKPLLNKICEYNSQNLCLDDFLDPDIVEAIEKAVVEGERRKRMRNKSQSYDQEDQMAMASKNYPVYTRSPDKRNVNNCGFNPCQDCTMSSIPDIIHFLNKNKDFFRVCEPRNAPSKPQSERKRNVITSNPTIEINVQNKQVMNTDKEDKDQIHKNDKDSDDSNTCKDNCDVELDTIKDDNHYGNHGNEKAYIITKEQPIIIKPETINLPPTSTDNWNGQKVIGNYDNSIKSIFCPETFQCKPEQQTDHVNIHKQYPYITKYLNNPTVFLPNDPIPTKTNPPITETSNQIIPAHTDWCSINDWMTPANYQKCINSYYSDVNTYETPISYHKNSYITKTDIQDYY